MNIFRPELTKQLVGSSAITPVVGCLTYFVVELQKNRNLQTMTFENTHLSRCYVALKGLSGIFNQPLSRTAARSVLGSLGNILQMIILFETPVLTIPG
jgi:hypothetical protein